MSSDLSCDQSGWWTAIQCWVEQEFACLPVKAEEGGGPSGEGDCQRKIVKDIQEMTAGLWERYGGVVTSSLTSIPEVFQKAAVSGHGVYGEMYRRSPEHLPSLGITVVDMSNSLWNCIPAEFRKSVKRMTLLGINVVKKYGKSVLESPENAVSLGCITFSTIVSYKLLKQVKPKFQERGVVAKVQGLFYVVLGAGLATLSIHETAALLHNNQWTWMNEETQVDDPLAAEG